MGIDRITNHMEACSEFVPEQYKGSNKLLSVIGAFASQIDDLELAFFEILDSLNPDTATGVSLDYIGEIVGVERLPAEADGPYRARVLMRAFLDSGVPAPEALRATIKYMSGASRTGLFPCWPAALYYVIGGSTTADLSPVERESMTSGASLGRGSFLCGEPDGDEFEAGYIVNEDNGMPIVCDWLGQDMPEPVPYITAVCTTDSFPLFDGEVSVDQALPDNRYRVTFKPTNHTNWNSLFQDYTEIEQVLTIDTLGNVFHFIDMFMGCTSLVSCASIDLGAATTIGGMFEGCTSLVSAPSMDTSGIRYFDRAFFDCSSLAVVPAYDYSSAMSLEYMFENCSSISNLPEMSIPNATEINGCFTGCSSLEANPLQDVGNVTTAEGLFYGCSSLTDDASLSWSSLENAAGMFGRCVSLSGAVTFSGPVGPMSCVAMYSNCTGMQSFQFLTATKPTNAHSMFQSCTALDTMPNLDLSVCTDTSSMFNYCISLTSSNGREYVTNNVTTMDSMFASCSLLRDSPKISCNSCVSAETMFVNCTALNSVYMTDTGGIKNWYRTFDNCERLTVFVSPISMASAEDVRKTFYFCSSIPSMFFAYSTYTFFISLPHPPIYHEDCFTGIAGDVSQIPTSWGGSLVVPANTLHFIFSDSSYNPSTAGVGTSGTWTQVSASPNVWAWTNNNASWQGAFNQAFQDANNLVSVIAAGDTSGVTNMMTLFRRCNSITSICMMDTSNVTNMIAFITYSQVKRLPPFDTSSVTDFHWAFDQSRELVEVPLFDTSAATEVGRMFDGCTSVESGALALYTQMSTQTTPPSNTADCFRNCGSNTTTGAAELAQIPTSWGGTMTT